LGAVICELNTQIKIDLLMNFPENLKKRAMLQYKWRIIYNPKNKIA